ncbi:MAG TPA: hypothetical protein VEG25_03555 [Burkholderiales bacterium]|nr:hypothetical protein [Burkholderiales bacterium]
MVSYLRSRGTNVLPVLLAGLLCAGEHAHAAQAVLHCTNLASGTTWDMPIDPQNGTANSFPATFTGESIDWHDVLHGGHYTFDHVSGALTVIYASSTGGFTLIHKCRFTQ